MKLKKVTLGQGVSRIERAAFRHCGLTGVSFPDSVTVIGEGCVFFLSRSQKGVVAEEAYRDRERCIQ